MFRRDGTEPRALSCYLPYSIRVDDPAATAVMQLQACCHVRSADARLINSRKILVRADVVCMLTGFEQASQEIRTLKDAPAALQTKAAEYRCVPPREFGEKSVTMTEDLELSAGEAGDGTHRAVIGEPGDHRAEAHGKQGGI